MTISAGAQLEIDTVISSPENHHAEDMPSKLNVRLGETDANTMEDPKTMLLFARKGGSH